MKINKKRILDYLGYLTQGISISDFVSMMNLEEDSFKYNFNISSTFSDITDFITTLNNVILIENENDLEELKSINIDINRFLNEYIITCIGDDKLYKRISQKFNLEIDDVYTKNIYLSYDNYDELIQCIDKIGITEDSTDIIKYKNSNGDVLFFKKDDNLDINDLNSKGFYFESGTYIYEFKICKKNKYEDKFDFDAAVDFKISLIDIPF